MTHSGRSADAVRCCSPRSAQRVVPQQPAELLGDVAAHLIRQLLVPHSDSDPIDAIAISAATAQQPCWHRHGHSDDPRRAVAPSAPSGSPPSAVVEIYGESVSKETISRITDKVIEEMTDWSHRPLDEIYAAVFIDASW
ncbi:hypothetical protein J3R08_005991 [Micromonospora sp. HB375]|nr:hypothetical protein [Micromonospora sp. HB375]MDH6471806.1 hypothetical protein [Micromonospora sp. H404/HB375]